MAVGQLLARTLPRQLTAMQLLEEDSDEDVYGGPWKDVTDAEERIRDAIYLLTGRLCAKAQGTQAWGPSPTPELPADRRRPIPAKSGIELAILPLPAQEELKEGKFVCHFEVGLEDDDEFCLVKRIYGKGGCNLKNIAEKYNVKLRLRGRGSGFLEGRGKKQEADTCLKLYCSCENSESYVGAVNEVAALLSNLYRHYRRYARSKGLEPPELAVAIIEEIRSDHGIYRTNMDQGSFHSDVESKTSSQGGAQSPPLDTRADPELQEKQAGAEKVRAAPLAGAAERAAFAACYRAATRASAHAARSSHRQHDVHITTFQDGDTGTNAEEDTQLMYSKLSKHDHELHGRVWIDNKQKIQDDFEHATWRNWELQQDCSWAAARQAPSTKATWAKPMPRKLLNVPPRQPHGRQYSKLSPATSPDTRKPQKLVWVPISCSSA